MIKLTLSHRQILTLILYMLSFSCLQAANNIKEKTTKTKPTQQKNSQKNSASAKGKKQEQSHEQQKLIPINSIKALVFGADETHIVTNFDLTRPAIFEGRFLSEKEYLERILTYEDAKKYKIPVDDDTVDKYLMGMQKEHNLSANDIKEMFKEAGYSYQEGRKALKMLYTNNSLIGFKINDRLIVAESAIQRYHDEHPEIEEAQYLLEIASVSKPEEKSPQELRSELEKAIKNNNIASLKLSWGEPFWIQDSDLAEEKKAITQLTIGNTWLDETYDGFDLYRLKDKREQVVRPLDTERRQEITEILRGPVYERIKQEYEQELWSNAAVSYPQPAHALKKLNVAKPEEAGSKNLAKEVRP